MHSVCNIFVVILCSKDLQFRIFTRGTTITFAGKTLDIINIQGIFHYVEDVGFLVTFTVCHPNSHDNRAKTFQPPIWEIYAYACMFFAMIRAARVWMPDISVSEAKLCIKWDFHIFYYRICIRTCTRWLTLCNVNSIERLVYKNYTTRMMVNIMTIYLPLKLIWWLIWSCHQRNTFVVI